MKCENCTKKECNKKQKNEDRESSAPADASSSNESDDLDEFHKLASAKIFLSDCLACDSCVSWQESTKIAQQNQKELFKILNLNKKCDTSKHKVLAVSVCPQSLPYFAAKFNLCVNDAAKRLCGFLKSLGVHHVFDTTIAADFSILESQKEFVKRYLQRNHDEHAFPMFASACPGWIRYAERILGNPVTPHICTAKSPQQIMGSLVKDYFARQHSLSPDKIFHIIVAPCYDRKLEALRDDYFDALYNVQDVDCVLTSGEIVQIMEQKNVSFKEVEEVALETINKDFQEVTLEHNGGTVLRFAAAYGFRNIQNMVLKLKKGKFPYHFVEVLACPGGCLNGKGQAQTDDGKPDRALLQQMEEIYTSIPIQLPETNPHVQRLYQDWLEGSDSHKTKETLHTSYSTTSQTSTSMDIKW
ncbi:nuclear prelamin A recognition factor isoform X2 [Pleurodeles waltl]|uniref:nuclear prelamin A recognition factor isoform X2 n=1 Tax=Pleurodeles waltl TaxID=8319 RepID=UPI003709ACDF